MGKRAYLYVRVSTDEQAEKGYSQKHQDDRLRQYCDQNNIEIAGVFWEDYSAKTFDRPEFKKLLEHLRKSKGSAELLLFLKWDRFSRNAGDAYGMINTLNKLGVEPQAIEQPLDLSIPENKIMLAFYLAAPEVENDRRSLNTIAGMRRAMKEGRHVNMAPRGYTNARDENNNPIIIPSKDATHVIWAFEEVAKGVHNMMDVWRMTKERGLNIGKSQFWKMLRNPLYCGRIYIPAYKDEEEMIRKATHEPIITEMLFDDVQDILEGRKRRLAVKQTAREEFPLRGFLECRKCGKKLTASKSKGNGGHYCYYHCSGGCNERIKAEEVNSVFIKKLHSFKPNEGSVKLLELMIKNATASSSEKQAYRKAIEKDMEKYRQRIKNIQEQLSDKEISTKDYNEMKSRYEREINQLEMELSKSKSGNKEIAQQIMFTIQLLLNLPKYYESADLICRQQIIGSIFLEKMIFEHGELRTRKVNKAVELICRPAKGSGKTLNEESSENSELSIPVPRTGFEPAHPFGHHHLKVACLPISTPGLWGCKCKVLLPFNQIYLELESF